MFNKTKRLNLIFYQPMPPSFLICKESKIESNTSFYGCFYMGPFEPNQSVTVANSLRRTLLSELYGLAITSVEIEGASHEYSNLKGVNESVLDIILNLKQLVLKKSFDSIKPLVGYLRVQGPANVYASDLRLPPFVQCVDPNHLIATLEEDGVLTMRVLIQYGNKWLSPPNHFFSTPTSGDFPNLVSSIPEQKNLKIKTIKKEEVKIKKETRLAKKERIEREKKEEETKAEDEKRKAAILKDFNSLPRKNLKNLLNFHFIKRRFIFNQVKNVGFILSKTYMEILSKQGLRLLKRADRLREKMGTVLSRWTIKKRYLGIDLKTPHYRSDVELLKLAGSNLRSESLEKVRNTKKKAGFTQVKTWSILKSTSKPITIDAVFNPVNKVNFTIEHNDYKTTLERLKHSQEVSEFYKLIRASNSRTFDFFSQLSQDYKKQKVLKPLPFPKGDTIASKVLKKKVKKQNQPMARLSPRGNRAVYHPFITSDKPGEKRGKYLHPKGERMDKLELLNDAKTTSLNLFLDYQKELDLLKNTSAKDNIILEIWTNGSLHPREALYQTFANLLQVFSRLNEITPFLNVLTHFAKLPSSKKMTPTMRKEWGPALKQIQAGKIETSLIPSLIPVTSESYLATYMTPHLRDFKTLLKPNRVQKSIKSNSKKLLKPIKSNSKKLLKPIKSIPVKPFKANALQSTPIKKEKTSQKSVLITKRTELRPTLVVHHEVMNKPSTRKTKPIDAEKPISVAKQTKSIPITVEKEEKLRRPPEPVTKQTAKRTKKEPK